jgi:predicted nucleotidyltransferase component of viral defense system
MEKKIAYPELYALQDKMLDLIFSLDNSFYLTGGTALHRFYYGLRYSDDLDLFVSDDDLFNEYVREIIDLLESRQITFEHTVKSRDFHRLLVGELLQIDFVNDRVHREGKSVKFGQVRVDNIFNILANKLSAIIGRDEEKDIFDLFAIARHESFDWGEILSVANKKVNIEKETLVYRLKSFPLVWLDNIKEIKPFEINRGMIDQMSDDIVKEVKNSMKKML